MGSREPRNVDQLRDDIDSGRTGDKVAFSDPAAAPLGTDDEAGGTPPSGERLKIAAVSEARPHAGGPKREGFPMGWIIIVAVTLVTGGAVILGAML
jgi:hypothetical protein